MNKLKKLIDELCTDNKGINCIPRYTFLFNMLHDLIYNGYTEDQIKEEGVQICHLLSRDDLSEDLKSVQELTIAYEIKSILKIIKKDSINRVTVDIEKPVESEEKEKYETIETDPDLIIDMDVSELNLQIEEDTSFLDSLRESKDE